MLRSRSVSWAVGAAVLAASACSDSTGPESPSPFELEFAAVYDGQIVGCGDHLHGFGPSGSVEVEMNDLRFFVSNLQFYDHDGAPIDVDLDTNEFQYTSADGSVALIDLTGASVGACSGTGVSFPEGTARTNSRITGTTLVDEVHSVSFDVGVPQAMQKTVLATHTAENAPSPLNELHWSWAYAYRQFIMNFALDDNGVPGEGYLHVGSTDCGGDGARALTDRASCGRPNAPRVELDDFHFDHVITVDLGAMLDGLDFRVDMGEGGIVPGVSMHSGPSQPHTPVIFGNFGLSLQTGLGSAASNSVFAVD